MKNNVLFLTIVLSFLLIPGGLRSEWLWHNPYPAGNDLYTIAVSESGYMALGGDAGLMIEVSDSTFSTPDFRTYERINDIALQGENGIAVCERGDVLIRDSFGWEVNKPETSAWFYGATVTASGEMWICGDLGQIFRFSGGAWQQTPSSTTTTLKDIAFYDDSRGWAVGLFGTARVWDGTAWRYYSSQTSRFLRSVSAGSNSAAWAVGDLGTITHWTGSGFSLETSNTTANLYDVVAINDSDAWAVGDSGTILRRTNGVWQVMTFPELPVIDFRSIAFEPPNQLWLVGRNGFVASYDGQFWTRLDYNALENVDILSIELWNPEGTVLLAGSGGALYEYNGSSFFQHLSGTTQALNRIHIDPLGTYWIGGNAGMLLKRNGESWMRVNTGNGDDIRDIHVLSENSIWTAGGLNDGSCVSWTVLHYTGTQWIVYSESGS